MIKSGIYYIKNCINGKRYIGQTINIDRRKQEHFNELRNNKHFNQHLQNSFNKYGESNFEFGIIQLCDKSELDELEIHYINLYDTQNHGYNICDGGAGGPGYSGENHGNWRDDVSNDTIQKMYESGYSARKIAASFSCPTETIRFRLKKIFGEDYENLAKERQRNERTDISNDEILKLARSGLNSVEIAERLDCNSKTIRDRLRKIMPEQEYAVYKSNNYSKLSSKNYEKRVSARKKYTLWDISSVGFYKGKGEGTRCFKLRYNHKPVKIGGFHDFKTVELISELIEECI